MSTFTEFIETPQAFTIQTVISEHPQYLDNFIQYLTVPQDPLISNERQCFLYPSKIADILSIGLSYKLLIEKKPVGGDKISYPFLEKFFTKIKKEPADPTLLGYCSKLLISLVKKTPEIYEFIKDNQDLIIEILKDDAKLEHLRQFVCLLLVESTMELYIFLKTMLVRNLIFKIVDEEEVGTQVYRSITYFYKQIVKAMDDVTEEQKSELQTISKLFEEEHFVTLLILKLDSSNSLRNNFITQFLSLACPRSIQATDIITLHIDSILDYLQQYEQSSIFMQQIKIEHISMLTLLVELVRKDRLQEDIVGQLIKRLLVYSNVHLRNNMVHNLLFTLIEICKEKGMKVMLNQLNIIQFFIKNVTEQTYGFMSLRRRVFGFWVENQLDLHLEEEQKNLVRKDYDAQKEKIQKSKYYRQFHVEETSSDLGSTKIASELLTTAQEDTPKKAEEAPSSAEESQS